jgi:hypothetical protein
MVTVMNSNQRKQCKESKTWTQLGVDRLQDVTLQEQVNKADLVVVLQGLLVVVLLITIGINIMFILDTSRRLHDEVQTTGEIIISCFAFHPLGSLLFSCLIGLDQGMSDSCLGGNQLID